VYTMSKLSTTTEKTYRASLRQPAGGWPMQRVTTHPGAVLREDFLKPLALSANALAIRLRIPATRLHAILHERRGVSPDTAMRLARCLGTSAELWLGLQTDHDLTKAQQASKEQIEREVEPYSAVSKAA
jgi:addiction module HigA family antidote